MSDTLKSALLIASLLMAGILINTVAVISYAKATNDPGAFYRESVVQGGAVHRSRARSHRRYAKRVHRHRSYRHAKVRSHRRYATASRGEVQIVSHPQGCPPRSFCGCGASIEVFGKSIRELWLAANWLKFPRAEPAPGMVAARRGHVFVIREVRGPGLVLAYDANSGGRKTRIHLRSLRGFVVVNPRGTAA